MAVHHVGNKANDESLLISASPLEITESLAPVLEAWFEPAFRTEKYFCFNDVQGELSQNGVYQAVKELFQTPDALPEISVRLAGKLFDVQDHPNIKAGEFYTVLFKDCIFDGETVDAVGFFKSENKSLFLKTGYRGEDVTLKAEEGIDIRNLDKGCVVFNTDADAGYTVAVVDKTGRSEEARFWVDRFLQLLEKNDAWHKTENALTLCKDFISEALPAEFEVSKADQADLLNRSAAFFRSNSNFDVRAFSNEVIEQPEVIEKFYDYKSQYETRTGRTVDDSFDISAPAVKRNNGVFKSVIKLDKNFHIYVHGNPSMIERGTENDGRKFYKVYFNEEN